MLNNVVGFITPHPSDQFIFDRPSPKGLLSGPVAFYLLDNLACAFGVDCHRSLGGGDFLCNGGVHVAAALFQMVKGGLL
jgi:hypothetical protein